MEATAISSAANGVSGASRRNGFEGLGSEDFLKLLIAQLTSQDPLEPTGNEELLQQISSIREIELSTTLTQSLSALTGQQRFASAAALLGQHVTRKADESGVSVAGVVTGVRFDASGQAILLLTDGVEVPLDQVAAVVSPLEAARALVGKVVSGVDQRDPREPNSVEGLVTGVRRDDAGEVLLELDNGKSLRLRDVANVSAANEG